MAGSEHDEEHPLRRRRSALLRREWQLSLYPQAAEAGGCLVTTRSGEAADALLTPSGPRQSQSGALGRRSAATASPTGCARRFCGWPRPSGVLDRPYLPSPSL
jgi:hypothetical protein